MHKVTGFIPNRTRWCGPTALACVTGLTYEAAMARLKFIIGRRQGVHNPKVRGVHTCDLLVALRQSGIKTKEITPRDKMTVARFLKTREDRTATYIVNAGRHYQVIRANTAIDNQYPDGVRTSKMRLRRAVIQNVWVVFQDSTGLPIPPMPKPKRDNQYLKARSLLRQHGMTYTRNGMGIEVEKIDGTPIEEDIMTRFFGGPSTWGDIVQWLSHV